MDKDALLTGILEGLEEAGVEVSDLTGDGIRVDHPSGFFGFFEDHRAFGKHIVKVWSAAIKQHEERQQKVLEMLGLLKKERDS